MAILFKTNFDFVLNKDYADPDGRFIILDIKTADLCFTLVNLYAPNKDDPHYFQNVNNRILEFDCDNIILGGDFNLIKNAKSDKEGGILGPSHPKALTKVEKIQINLDLGDIWRDQNPLDKRFTWRRRKPSKSCQLDFFLLSRHLYGKVAKSDIVAGYKTDHSMISLSLGLAENIRGPGLWKLNTSFLIDEEYLKCIKKVILKTCDDYKDDKDVDDALLWEMIKLKVRESSIFYGKEKAKSRGTDETKQYDTITYLERKIDGRIYSDCFLRRCGCSRNSIC